MTRLDIPGPADLARRAGLPDPVVELLDVGQRAAAAADARQLAVAAAAAVLLALTALIWRGRRRRIAHATAVAAGKNDDKWAESRTDRLVSRLAILMGMGVIAQGMWDFFTHQFGLTGLPRMILFAFVEVIVYAEARRAIRYLRRTCLLGADAYVMMIVFAASAILSASDARSPQVVIARIFAALVVSLLWWRELAEIRDRLYDDLDQTKREKVDDAVRQQYITILINRWLARLGLISDAGKTVSDIERDRRIAHLARLTVRLDARLTHRATRGPAAAWDGLAVRILRWRRQRALVWVVVNLNLGNDQDLQLALAGQIHALREFDDFARPEHIRTLVGWVSQDDVAQLRSADTDGVIDFDRELEELGRRKELPAGTNTLTAADPAPRRTPRATGGRPAVESKADAEYRKHLVMYAPEIALVSAAIRAEHLTLETLRVDDVTQLLAAAYARDWHVDNERRRYDSRGIHHRIFTCVRRLAAEATAEGGQ